MAGSRNEFTLFEVTFRWQSFRQAHERVESLCHDRFSCAKPVSDLAGTNYSRKTTVVLTATKDQGEDHCCLDFKYTVLVGDCRCGQDDRSRHWHRIDKSSWQDAGLSLPFLYGSANG